MQLKEAGATQTAPVASVQVQCPLLFFFRTLAEREMSRILENSRAHQLQVGGRHVLLIPTTALQKGQKGFRAPCVPYFFCFGGKTLFSGPHGPHHSASTPLGLFLRYPGQWAPAPQPPSQKVSREPPLAPTHPSPTFETKPYPKDPSTL